MPAHGVLLVHKAVGDTSTDVVRIVKKAFNTKKVGHTGTLDPFATGLLPICLGEALKYSRWLLDATKTYEFTLALGVKTDTADCTGDVIAEATVPNSLNLELARQHFQGEMSQIPPKFSALKVNGKRAYELARKGENVALAARQVTIHEFSLQQREAAILTGRATVSKGTYIRTLCEDIAEQLGSVGHCAQLRRTAVTPYSLANQTVTTHELKNYFEQTDKTALHEKLLSIDSLCQQFPECVIDETVIKMLRQGKKINLAGNQGLCRLYAKNLEFIGLGQHEKGQLKAFRLMRCDT